MFNLPKKYQVTVLLSEQLTCSIHKNLICKASTTSQQIKQLLVTLISHAGSSSGCSTSNSTSFQYPWKWSCLELCHLCCRSGWGSRVLHSDWVSLYYYGNLGSELVDGKSLSTSVTITLPSLCIDILCFFRMYTYVQIIRFPCHSWFSLGNYVLKLISSSECLLRPHYWT